MSVSLPPLPPIPGDDSDYRPGGRSVVAVLTEEHRQLTDLCGELASRDTDPERRRKVTEVFAAELSRHLSAEEQYLLPATRTDGDGSPESRGDDGDGTAERERIADQEILRTLKELTDVDPERPEHPVVAGRLADLLAEHVTRMGREVLPRLRETTSDTDLVRLGNRVEIAEEAAPTRPHPDSPNSPPWNRVVEPAIGVVDKVRDAVTNRPTRQGDLAERDGN